MAEIIIKHETLPIRCEICHQADCFDPELGSCTRCGNINNECQKLKVFNKVKQYKLDIKRSKLYFCGRISYVIGSIIFCLSLYFIASIKYHHHSLKISNSDLSSVKITIIKTDVGAIDLFYHFYKIIIDGSGEVICEVSESTNYKTDSYGQGICEVQIKRKSTHLSEQEVRKLISYFDEADFFDLKDSYYHDCSHWVTHAPIITTSISINGKNKLVEDYLGQDCSPTELRNLEEKTNNLIHLQELIKQASDYKVTSCNQWNEEIRYK